jgi:peptidoglycan/xylan/chitin deacetylase (PgdA/CDA1 family)
MKKEVMITIFILIGVIILVFLSSNFTEDKQGCLALTFDDGLKSHYDIVYPMLSERNLDATFFVVPDIDSDFYGRELMNEYQIQELVDVGFEIGSHTVNHPDLSSLDEDEIEREIEISKKMLEEKYGTEVFSIAFPYGKYNRDILGIAKKYYLNGRAMFNYGNPGFLILSYGLTNEDSVDEICNNINYANDKELFFTLVFHDVIESPMKWDTSIEDFEKILDCAEKSGIHIDSLKDCQGN